MKEQWRKVVGHEGYEVSDHGRVRSFRRGAQGRILRPGIAGNGYPTVALGRGNTRTVHSLVANAFIGPCPKGQEVRHRDNDRANPKLTNLHYGTRLQNIMDRVEHGTHNRGERHGGCRLTEAEVIAIRAASGARREIAELFGCCNAHVSNIKNGKSRRWG